MNRLYIFTLFALLSIQSAMAKDLEFQKILFNRDDAEISGLSFKDDYLLFVADKLSNRAIYKIRFENNRFFYKNFIDIANLQNHDTYFAKALLFKHGGRVVKSPFDLEGITYCKDNFYLVNEQARHVLKITKKSLTRIPLNFEDVFKQFGSPLNKIPTNAGLEGIAVDCKNQILYVAQERQPRAIIVIDLKQNKITDIFNTTVSSQFKITPDYADLYFENGYLYVLERNFHQVLKIDPKTKKVIEKYSFLQLDEITAKEIYKTNKPYGVAEGLTMNKEQIFIAIDNNKDPISKKAQKKYSVKGNFSSLLIFKRPKNF